MMRIQNLSYFTPTFGYNKTLSNELNKKLKSDNSREANALIQLNNSCNKTEDEIRGSDDTLKNMSLVNTLLNSKFKLASAVEVIFPEMNYTAREKYSYDTGAYKSVKDNRTFDALWQYCMGYGLSQILIDLNDPAEQAGDGDFGVEFMPQDSNVADELIEEFTPDEFSPKGFDSLGGMEKLKEELYDKIIYPVTHPEEADLDFEEYGKRPPRGVLLYGPPGCGKTTIAEALSQEADLPLFKLKISKAGSPYINATSANYQAAFDKAAMVAEETGKPCFMLIDEIDGLTKARDQYASSEDLKQMGTLLNLIETARNRNIFVIAATNKYDIIDPAIKRRFDEQIYVPLPDLETREKIVYKALAPRLKGIPLAESQDDLKEIAQKMEGFPSSAIIIIADKASDNARKDGRRIITKDDFFNEIAKNDNLKITENDFQSSNMRKSVGFR